MAYVDILRYALTCLVSMIVLPRRLSLRAWRCEFVCRFMQKNAA